MSISVTDRYDKGPSGNGQSSDSGGTGTYSRPSARLVRQYRVGPALGHSMHATTCGWPASGVSAPPSPQQVGGVSESVAGVSVVMIRACQRGPTVPHHAASARESAL